MRIDRKSTSYDITWFLDHYERKLLNLDPPYQRKSIWKKEDKQFYIDTILNNYPCPPVFLNKLLDDLTGKACYNLIDGKQRIVSIIEFSENRIKSARSDNQEISEKFFDGLNSEYKRTFWDYIPT